MHEFTVATFNVHGWKDAKKKDNLVRVIQTVRKYGPDQSGPDIICLQELNGNKDQLVQFAKYFDYHFFQTPGVAILSKFEVRSIPTVAGARFAVSEIALSPEVKIIVTGIHLDHKKEPKRLSEIQVIRNALGSIFSEDCFQIWLGDFNALTLDDYTEDELNKVARVRREGNWEPPKGELTQKITNEYGLIDTWQDVGGPPPLKTCRYDTRIDYIFANPQLLDVFDVVDVIHDTDTASDHQMVVTKFVSKTANRPQMQYNGYNQRTRRQGPQQNGDYVQRFANGNHPSMADRHGPYRQGQVRRQEERHHPYDRQQPIPRDPHGLIQRLRNQRENDLERRRHDTMKFDNNYQNAIANDYPVRTHRIRTSNSEFSRLKELFERSMINGEFYNLQVSWNEDGTPYVGRGFDFASWVEFQSNNGGSLGYLLIWDDDFTRFQLNGQVIYVGGNDPHTYYR